MGMSGGPIGAGLFSGPSMFLVKTWTSVLSPPVPCTGHESQRLALHSAQPQVTRDDVKDWHKSTFTRLTEARDQPDIGKHAIDPQKPCQ